MADVDTYSAWAGRSRRLQEMIPQSGYAAPVVAFMAGRELAKESEAAEQAMKTKAFLSTFTRLAETMPGEAVQFFNQVGPKIFGKDVKIESAGVSENIVWAANEGIVAGLDVRTGRKLIVGDKNQWKAAETPEELKLWAATFTKASSPKVKQPEAKKPDTASREREIRQWFNSFQSASSQLARLRKTGLSELILKNISASDPEFKKILAGLGPQEEDVKRSINTMREAARQYKRLTGRDILEDVEAETKGKAEAKPKSEWRKYLTEER